MDGGRWSVVYGLPPSFFYFYNVFDINRTIAKLSMVQKTANATYTQQGYKMTFHQVASCEWQKSLANCYSQPEHKMLVYGLLQYNKINMP